MSTNDNHWEQGNDNHVPALNLAIGVEREVEENRTSVLEIRRKFLRKIEASMLYRQQKGVLDRARTIVGESDVIPHLIKTTHIHPQLHTSLPGISTLLNTIRASH